MKIAQLVSNLHPVSTLSNNAIYSHVGGLTDGLVADGHEVTLFAAGDSTTRAALRSVTDRALAGGTFSSRTQQHLVRHLIAACYEAAGEFDLIHSHFTLLSSFHARTTTTPTIVSIHSPIDDEIRDVVKRYKDIRYVSFSLAQRKVTPELNWYANVYHGIDTKLFEFNAKPKDYFLYLGRVTQDKGVHLAIQAAKQAGVPLIIAGRSYPTEGYWHAEIEKNIDGVTVSYVGEKGLADKIELLQNARALLFPTQCQEVFGYVMIESLACGTPVIGWNNGSVPEIVKHGKTGYVVDSVQGMAKAIRDIDRISRVDCRRRAVDLFSVEKMLHGYERVYERVIKETKRPGKRVAKKENFLASALRSLLKTLEE